MQFAILLLLATTASSIKIQNSRVNESLSQLKDSDFDKALAGLDTDKDGLISLDELRKAGIDERSISKMLKLAGEDEKFNYREFDNMVAANNREGTLTRDRRNLP